MATPSPGSAKRTDPRNVAVLLASLGLAAFLCYSTLQPVAQDFNVSINLNGDEGTASLVEAEGGEEAVQAAVAVVDLEEEEQQEEPSHTAANRPQQTQQQQKQQQQQQQQLAAEQLPAQQQPAMSNEQRSLIFSATVGPCLEGGGFDCLTRQAGVDPAPNQFRFPHFFLVGFQKCATTSLFHHLVDHPQIEDLRIKEPEFFTHSCEFNAMRCGVAQQRKYMEETLRFREAAAADFTTASFEGSTHYVLEGNWLAAQLRDLFPWLKIVVSMREPISQAIAMVLHNIKHKRNPECYKNEHVFPCILDDLDVESRYAKSLRPWLKHFPREQLHLMQYEHLTSKEGMRPALRELKRFLRVDPSLPSDNLGLFNYRHQRNHTQGWSMRRDEYLQLVEKARRNAEEVVEIVREFGFGDADVWMQNWEQRWQENLDNNCEAEMSGACMVQVA